MGIVRRSSRVIVIDEQTYLWKLTDDHRYIGNAYASPTLTVGIKDFNRGQVLQCRLISKQCGTEEPDLGYEPVLKAAVTPGDVEKVIRMAMSLGWKPSAKKPSTFKFLGPLDLKDYTVG